MASKVGGWQEGSGVINRYQLRCLTRGTALKAKLIPAEVGHGEWIKEVGGRQEGSGVVDCYLS